MEIIKVCRRKQPYTVNRMQPVNFLSTGKLEKQITNRRKDTTGNAISWLQTLQIRIEKDNSLKLFFGKCFVSTMQEVDIEKSPGRARNPLPLLWPNGKAVSRQKRNNLKCIYSQIKGFSEPSYMWKMTLKDLAAIWISIFKLF